MQSLMVGVLSRREHSKASPSKRLVGLKATGLGLSKVLLGPSTLADPFSGNRGLPRVPGPSQALAAVPPWPPQCIGVGMAGDSRHVLVPAQHQGIVRHVHLGHGAIDAGQGERFARALRHEHHHGHVWGEQLGV